MKDAGYEHAHSSPIKTPQQLAVVLVLSFALPVIGIILLTQFIVMDRSTDAATLAPEAVAARIQPVARVELAAAGAEPPAAATAAPTTPAGPTPTPPPVQVATAPAAAAPAAAAGASPEELLKKDGCLVCHATDKKLVGPSYKEVAAKYAGDNGALAKLVQKVKDGGAGVWGQIPMPPHPQVSEADLQTMVKYILAQK